jgi:hypothetical protein
MQKVMARLDLSRNNLKRRALVGLIVSDFFSRDSKQIV